MADKTTELTWIFQPHIPHENCKCCEPTHKNIFEELLNELKTMGYHEDVVARFKIALLTPQGFEVFVKYKLVGYETLVQKMLDVYKDITNP